VPSCHWDQVRKGASPTPFVVGWRFIFEDLLKTFPPPFPVVNQSLVPDLSLAIIFSKISACLAIFGTSYVSCAVQLIPRGKVHELFTGCTTNASEVNSTTLPPVAAVTIEPGYTTSSLDCCYIEAVGGGVDEIIWWSSSIEITVATVSTVVYQYNNTAITSYTTNSVYNASNPLPTTLDSINTYGVPTGLISNYDDSYWPTTSLNYATAFTDPYGVVYESPTPVIGYIWATLVSPQFLEALLLVFLFVLRIYFPDILRCGILSQAGILPFKTILT
jgi:hypothetical protein